MADGNFESGLATCPKCGNDFMPRRKNMKFCSDNCRKAHSRPTQNSENSPSKARKNRMFFDTARLMGERYYDLPLTERLGHMKDLIDKARKGDTFLREVLSNYKLRHLNPKSESWMFPKGRRNYSTIAQVAQHYCWKFWRANVDDVVYCRVAEPPTGEVFDDNPE